MMDSKDIASYYDSFSAKQEKTAVNARHRTILRRLKKAGLQHNHHVLEIGCGIGTVTGLLAAYLSGGTVTGTDISPKSIALAKKRLSKYSNVELLVTDMADFSQEKKFDVIVLPDVLEHIPLENHREIFRTVRTHLHEDGFVAINIPDPYYNDWVRENKPELLQIIDQSLLTDRLLQDAYANELHLHFFEAYSLFTNDPNYNWILLKPNRPFREGGPGKLMKAIENYTIRLR